MNILSTRRAVALVGAALTVSVVPALAATSASAAEGDLTVYKKSLTYSCDARLFIGDLGGDIVVDNQTIVADVSFALAPVKPNTRLDPIDVNVDLTLPEDLRGASVDLLQGVQADGESSSVVLGIRDANGRLNYRIPKISAQKSAIPQEKGKPWTISATGKTPRIDVFNASPITASAPEYFDIDASVYREDGSSTPVNISCDNEGDRTVATIPVGVTPTVTAKVEPGTVKAGADDTTVLVKTTSPVRATGLILLQTESGKTVGNAFLNKTGNVRIKLAPYFKTGRRTLNVIYFGDADNVQAKTSTKFSVVD